MKPMLAATPDDLNQLKFPMLASPKLDGIRAIIRDGVVYSRRLKPIPNIHVQRAFAHLDWFDGELIYRDPTSLSCYRDTSSAVMGQDSPKGKEVEFYAFDHFQDPTDPYWKRQTKLCLPYKLDHVIINSLQELLEYETAITGQGYEGVMLRHPDGMYKYGRSTMREHLLIKIKRFIDNEFVVVGFEEQMHNANPAQRNEIGQLKRSSHQANMVPKGTLGSLLLKFDDHQIMSVGSGFTDTERQHIWDNQEAYLGRLARVKWFPVGMKDLPRHPTFLGWRDE